MPSNFKGFAYDAAFDYCNSETHPTLQGCRAYVTSLGTWELSSDAVDAYFASGEDQLEEAFRLYAAAKKRDPAADVRSFFVHLHQFKELKAMKPLTEEQRAAARSAVRSFAREQLEKAETTAAYARADAAEFGEGAEGQAAQKIAERYAAMAVDFAREKKLIDIEQRYLRAMEADNIKDAMLSWKPRPEQVSMDGSCKNAERTSRASERISVFSRYGKLK